mgnify:CR=1 FL=1
MNNEVFIDKMIMSQLEIYGERARYFQDQNDTEMSEFFIAQGFDLIRAASQDEELMFIDTSDLK